MKKILSIFIFTLLSVGQLFTAEEEHNKKEPVEVYVPPVGTTHLKPSEKNPDEYEGLIPENEPQIELGPLILKQGTLKILPGPKVVLTAQATFMGKTAEVGIFEVEIENLDFVKGISFKSITLGLKFKDALQIEVIPGKSIALNEITVKLEKNKPIVMTGTTTWFGVTAKVAFEAEQTLTAVSLTFPHIALAQLVPEVEQSPLIKSVELYGVSLKYYVVSKTTTIFGTAEILGYDVDLTIIIGMPLPEVREPSRAQQKIISNDTINYQISTLFSAPVLNLEKSITDQNITSWTQFVDSMKSYFEKNGNAQMQQMFLQASGIGYDFINIIKISKNVRDNINHVKQQAEKLNDLKTKLKGLKDKKESLSKKIDEENEQLRSKGKLNPREETILKERETALNKLFGFIDLLSIKMTTFSDNLGKLSLKEKLKKLDPKKPSISIEGSFKAPKPIKPFEKYTIPYVSDMAFVGASLAIDFADKELEIVVTGDTIMFNLPLKAKIRYKTDEHGEPLVLLQAALPEQWRLSDVDKKFKDTIFDELAFEELQVIVATKDYEDHQLDVQLKRGINFYGKVYLSGPLSPLTKILKVPTDLTVPFFLGFAATDPLASIVHLGFEGKLIKLSSKATIEKFTVEITGKPTPSVALLGTTKIVLSEDELLQFITRLQFSVTNVLLAGSLKGTWHNAFTIKGVDLTDVALQAGIDIKSLSAGIPLDIIGMTGQMALSKYVVKLAGNISLTNPDKLVLSGELNQLMFDDLLDIARALFKVTIPTESIPEFGLQEVTVYMATNDTKIGEFNFEQGMTIAGTLIIPGLTAKVRVHPSKEGIIGYGYATPIKWGPVIITGQTQDKKEGLTVDIHLTKSKQEIYADGVMEIEPVFKMGAHVQFTKTEIIIKGETIISNTFKAIIDGRAALTSNPDLYLIIDFEADFNEYLLKLLSEKLVQFEKTATKGIKEAEEELLKIDNTIRVLDEQITAKRAQIANLSSKESDEKLENLREEVAKWQAKWDKLSDTQKALRSVDIGIPLGSSKGALQVAEKTLLAKQAITLEQELLDLEVKKFSLKIAQDSARDTLQAAHEVAKKGISQAGQFIVNNILKSIEIRHARFETHARDLLKGSLPALTLDIVLFGKRHLLKDLFFDIRDPKKSAKSVAENLFKFIVETEPEALTEK